MNNQFDTVRVVLLSALFYLALLLIKTAPWIFIPLFILIPLVWLSRRGRAHFGEDDPADWWKRGSRE